MFRLTYLSRLLGPLAILVIPLLLAVVIAWKLFTFTVVMTTRYVIGAPMLGGQSTDATFWSDGTRRIGHPMPWEFGKPSRWSLMAWRRRAGWRLVVPTAVAVVVFAWLRWPSVTEWTVVFGLATVAGIKEWRGLHWWRLRDHLRTRVMPLHLALAERVGLDPESVRPGDWLNIPRNYADSDADPRIRIELPTSFYAGADEDEEELAVTGGERAAIPGLRRLVDDQVFSKLELDRSTMTTRYHMAGPRPMVEYRHQPPIPELVPVDTPEVVTALDKANASTVVFGVAKGGRVVKFDLNIDNPHVLLSMPTNGGKSWTVRAAVTPLLEKDKDVRVVILDSKFMSHDVFRPHPHVRIVSHVADIHDELIYIGEEAARRNEAMSRGEDPGPRLIVVIEEANALADLLSEHWAKVKPPSFTGPCPSTAGMRRVPFLGREAGMHQILVSQEGNIRAVGGMGARTNYGHIFFGRGTGKNAWRNIAPELKMPRKKAAMRGRVYYAGGPSPEELQVIAWPDEKVREYAFRGFLDDELVPGSQCDREGFYQGKHRVTVTSDATTVTNMQSHENTIVDSHETVNVSSYEGIKTGSQENERPRLVVVDGNASAEIREVVPESAEVAAQKWVEEFDAEEPQGEPVPDDEPVTLREAVERGVVYANRMELRNPVDALRRVANSGKGTQRYDPAFPRPVGLRGQAKLYRPSQLRFWERNSAPGAADRQRKGDGA